MAFSLQVWNDTTQLSADGDLLMATVWPISKLNTRWPPDEHDASLCVEISNWVKKHNGLLTIRKVFHIVSYLASKRFVFDLF